MQILLDTHAFLWFIMGDNRLSSKAKSLIEDTSNERLLSTASLWEIAIKVSKSKLDLSKPFEVLIPQQMQINRIDKLDIEFGHMTTLINLPFHHKDPFDRLLISQCIVEQIPILSRDVEFDLYPIQREW